AAQHGRDRPGQCRAAARTEVWPEPAGAAHQDHVLAPARLAGPGGRVLDAAGHDLEARVALAAGLMGPVGDDEDRHAEAGVVAPAVHDVVHRPPDDPGTPGGEDFVEVSLVDGVRGAADTLVRPRPAEDPVVQPLAAFAEAGSGPVVRAGHIAVERHRDP